MVKSRNFQLLKQRFFLPVSEHRFFYLFSRKRYSRSNKKFSPQNFKIKSQNLDSFKNFKIFFEEISKKNFFQKNFSFVLKNTLKSPQHKKVKKKFFLGQIGLEFFPTTTNWLIVRFQEQHQSKGNRFLPIYVFTRKKY